MKTLYVVVLADGTEHRGEFLGAIDGHMLLSNGEGITRIDQRLVNVVGMKQVPSDE